MKTFRNISLALCIAAALIISGFINLMGGIGLCFFVDAEVQTYKICGICLFASSIFLIFGTIAACFKKVWLPFAANIIGTICYIYTVTSIYAIPNSLVSKTDTEPLAERHLSTVIVTLLLFIITIINYMDEKNVNKRNINRQKKHDQINRQLTDEEKIL